MKRHLREPADWYLTVMAAFLFLAGGALIFTTVSSAVAFAVIAIAAVLGVLAFSDSRPRGGGAH